jgi:hypothetical protein
MKHRGVAPAEEERMEFWNEGAGGGKLELYNMFEETTGMVLESEGESILNSEKSRLKANSVQEGTKGIPLLALSTHVGNKLPLAEERRGAAVGILEPMELLRGEYSQTGVDEEC